VLYARMDVRFLVPLYFLCLRQLSAMSRDLMSSPPSPTLPPAPVTAAPSRGGPRSPFADHGDVNDELTDSTEDSAVVCVKAMAEADGGEESSPVWMDSFENGATAEEAQQQEAQQEEEEETYAASWDQWGVEVEEEEEDPAAAETPLDSNRPSRAVAPLPGSSATATTTATATLSEAPSPAIPPQCLTLIVQVFSLTHKAASTLWTPPLDPRTQAHWRAPAPPYLQLHPYATKGLSSTLLTKKISGFRQRRKSKKWAPINTFVAKRYVVYCGTSSNIW
jgi:hypothetical protein